MLDAIQFQAESDLKTPEELKEEILLLGAKYRRFRGVSRETVNEVREVAEYFVRWMGRIKDEASSKQREGRIRRIERAFTRLASRLGPLQARVAVCVDAYGEVQVELEGLSGKAKQLKESSENLARTFALVTVCAAFLAPAAVLAEEALLAVGAGSAGIAGQSLQASYADLGEFHAKFLATTQKVAAKVRYEQDRLEDVRLSLEGAATDAAYLAEDFQEDDFKLLAASAEEGEQAFAKLAERCSEYLAASAYETEPTGYLMG